MIIGKCAQVRTAGFLYTFVVGPENRRYTQNEVIWDFESTPITRFEYMPMEKWI